jgi:SAM-dependent methyltransferase
VSRSFDANRGTALSWPGRRMKESSLMAANHDSMPAGMPATSAAPLRLNIGAGLTRIPDFTNVDIAPWADVTLDLGRERLPFDDDSVDLIFSYHTLEHIPDYLFALSEIHRVLKHGAPLLVGLPYITLTEYHLVNPYHLHGFNEFSFDFFDPSKLLNSAAEEALTQPPIFQQSFCRMHYMGAFNLLPPIGKKWSRRHLMNVVRKIDFGVLAVKDSSIPVTADAEDLKRQFLECLQARVGYRQVTQPVRAPSSRVASARATARTARNWWNGRDD